MNITVPTNVELGLAVLNTSQKPMNTTVGTRREHELVVLTTGQKPMSTTSKFLSIDL